MTTTTPIEKQSALVAVEEDVLAAADAVDQDLLVEDVSIDGMCGVY
jgi:mycofactocin precursor